ncbi:MAG: M23 family metallopeptidase [Spirochaetes bacterium]|jgi:murein DD-endopeptidase MepM/ murein hydrolase activator NlpD|nr:M23 family metallopeptidase [Spirochaetota bacterium]
MKIKFLLFVFISTFLTVSCISQQTKAEQTKIDIAPENPYKCLGYNLSEKSSYLLPYPVGTDYHLVQGNCTRYSHKGTNRYAYDFGMPIGHEITAARGGLVYFVDMDTPDNTFRGKRRYRRYPNARGNAILIEHDDGTVGVYFHLKQNGALVKKGDTVVQGQPIALSGSSGFTTGPHLHFAVRRSRTDRQSLPVTFRNADPGEDFNLKSGNTYLALNSDK